VKRSPNPATVNTGSLARDHLANERTFLAWVRTALGIIGLGVLLAKLVETEGLLAEIAGLAMVGMGGAALLYAVVRYERVRELLDSGRFRAASTGPLLLAAIALVVAVAGVVFVLL
jgi:putative membrane protein